MNLHVALGLTGVGLFALFVALGVRVSNRPLTRVDAAAVYFRGQLTPIALAFTISGRGPAMTAACVLSIGIFAALRLPLGVPVFMALAQLLSQTIAEWAKARFRRLRPDYWLVGREAGHSYPSGHATTAVVFFIGWAAIVALAALPPGVKAAVAGVLALWAAGIMWSRLALGAHYLTDVCGGALFAGAWLCMFFTVSAHFYVFLR